MLPIKHQISYAKYLKIQELCIINGGKCPEFPVILHNNI